MAINLKIIAISLVIVALVIGGAGYFYISRLKKPEIAKESVTKVTGGPVGRVEVIGRKELVSEEKVLPSALLGLRERIEQVRLRGQNAPEPEAPKIPKPGESISLGQEKTAEAVIPSEIKVLPGAASLAPPSPAKGAILAPNQYSSKEEFKKEAEKYFSDSYIKTLSLTQDALISAGFLKESDKSPLKNEEDVRKYWKNYTSFLLSKTDLTSLTPAQREMFTKGNIDISRLEPDFVGFKGEGSVLPLGSSMAESFAARLEFSAGSNFTEEELIKHFYPNFYLNQLLRSQEDMVRYGFIKPEERVFLKTRKEVEWLMLKEVEFSGSGDAKSKEVSSVLKNAITATLPKIQQEEISKIGRYLPGGYSQKDNNGFISTQADFILRFGDLLGAFFGMLVKPGPVYAAEVIGGGGTGSNPLEDKPPACDIGWSFYTSDVGLDLIIGIGAKKLGGPMEVEIGKGCWRSVMYDADPYKADDWRACLYWGEPLLGVPPIFKGKTNWGPNTIPPGECYVPGPGFFFPTRCCNCFREDVCVFPPFVTAPYPWGCHFLCPFNLLWDGGPSAIPPKTNICGCGL